MRHVRTSLAAGLVLPLVAAATTWAAMLSWGPFTERDPDFLLPLFLLGVTVAGTGAVARWWRLPGVAVVSAQVVAGGLVLCWTVLGVALPIGAGWAQTLVAFSSSAESARSYVAPVPAGAPTIAPLLVAGGLATMLVVDLLTCTLRRVPLAGLPLLTVYSVPISLLGDGISVWVFVPTAVGFMAMLYLHETEQINRWGRPLDQHGQAATAGSLGVRTGASRAKAGTIGSVATALAVGVPLIIPTLSLQLFDFGRGPGDGSEVTIQNPTADLLRDLNRGPDIPLLTVTTDDPDPEYLRVTVLKRFSGSEWSPGNRDIPPENQPDGPMPPLQGVSSQVPRQEYRYQVAIENSLNSSWLPTQAPISAIQAPGDWRYDSATTDFFRWDEDLDTRGIEYSMTAVDLDITARGLETASLATSEVDDEYTDLPDDLPDLVERLAFEVTGDAVSKYDKAVVLQDWFRANFEYSLRRGPRGSGSGDLEAFLTPGEEGRVGYCEQFAASMATMARVLGIPARMAVGFLTPERVGNGTYVYSSDDLHAWPELYFDGFGWVPFEPTPPVRAESVPSYARGLGPVGPDGNPRASDSASPSTSASPRAGETLRQDPQAPNVDPTEADGATGGTPWLAIGGGLLGGALVVLALLTPAALRRRARADRLAAGPEGVWAELRATAEDLRLPWPASRSPRDTRDRLVELFGQPGDEWATERPARGPAVNPDAVLALDRIVRDLELLRYSRSHAVEAGVLSAEALTCLEALEAGVVPRVRRRARWWPVTALPGARSRSRAQRSGGASAEGAASWSGVVEHIG